MQHTPSIHRRRRWLAPLLAIGLVAAIPLAGASPAAADTAPLYTEDAIGLRVDRTAIDGPALGEIETALQPFVNNMIHDGASDSPPVGSIQNITTSSDLQLDFQVLDPGGAYSDGAVEFNATIADIEIEYRVNAWWHSACSVFVWPDDATVDITAKLDINRLPDTPIELDDISATWDDDPAVHTTSFACDVHLAWNAFLNFWSDLFDSSDPESTASKIENMLEDTAQDLIDDLWTDHVTPVLDSLEGFGVHIQEVYTENQGLVVIADTDATGGIELPGISGSFDVSGAADSGANTDLADVLSNRTNDVGDSHVIASVHQNLVNQVLHAMHQWAGTLMFHGLIDSGVIHDLVDPDDHGDFGGLWQMQMRGWEPYHAEPSALDGSPVVQIPDFQVQFFNQNHGAQPVATFIGTLDGIGLVTDVRDDGIHWGPALSTDDLDVSGLTLDPTRSHPDVIAWDPGAENVLSQIQLGVETFNETAFVDFMSLAPLVIGNLSVDLCEVDVCGRYAGDENYTETFLVTEL